MKKITFLVPAIIGMVINSFIGIAQTHYIYTVAGGGSSYGDGGPATSAQTNNIAGIWVDGSGNLYISDHTYQTVREINAITGIISSVAGNATGGYSGDGGPATAAEIRTFGIFANANNFVFASAAADVIRKVDVATGIISTVAGVYSGPASGADGIPATDADLTTPLGVFEDAVGNIYISEDAYIRKVNSLTGIITTIAGNGTGGYTGDGGPARSASIDAEAYGMAIDASGNFYFADGNVIRKIDAATGNIYTVAGTGVSGFSGDGGPATNAKLFGPQSIAIDIYGNLLIGDLHVNQRIRMVNAITGIITTVAGGGTSTSDSIDASTADIGEGYFCLDDIGNIFICGTPDAKIKKITNFYPNIGSGSPLISDSFVVAVNNLCNGPQLTVMTENYIAGRSVKTFFGDGSTDSSTITPGFLSGGYALINHTYATAGTYNIRQILYSGSTVVDSIALPYSYTFCRTLPIQLFYDYNGNCLKDPGEPFSTVPLVAEVDSNGISVDTVSATSGFSYNAYGLIGDIYKFNVLGEPGSLSATCPSSGFIIDTISATVSPYPTKLFGLSCPTASSFDLQVNSVIPVTGRSEQRGNIFVRNNTCEPTNATITLQFSPKYIYTGEGLPTPTSFTTNTISWNLTGLLADGVMPIELNYIIWDNTITGLLTPGDTVQEYVTVTPIAGDENPSNNVNIIVDTVRASCDPNEMEVAPSGCLPFGVNQLQYTINFENTGNDTAFNIYVMDTISGYFDPRSIRIIAASATMNISIFKAGYFNIVQFDFPNINLLDSSYQYQCDGSVIFTINTKGNLPEGTAIENHAGIFFDQNPVVMTNTVVNTVGCAPTYVPIISKTNNVQIYPNPTTGLLTINTDNNAFNSCTITNSIGQIYMQQQLNATITQLNVTILPAGVYYVILKGENGMKMQKLVKF